MDLDQADEIYKKESEDAKELFLNAIKEKKNRKEADVSYRESLKRARDKYYKNALSVIKKKKPTNFFQKFKIKKKEKFDRLDIKPANLTLSTRQKFKFKMNIFFFVAKIRFRNLMHKIFIPPVSYEYYNAKNKTKRGFIFTRDVIRNIFVEVFDLFKSLFFGLKEILVNISKFIMGIPSIFFKKKKKPEEGKKPEAKAS